MKIKTITYHKVFNLGNYSNEKIGCEVEIGENDDPVKCHFEAVRFVEKAHLFQHNQEGYNRAKEIIASPMNYTGNQVKQATAAIEDFEKNFGDFLETFETMNLKQIQKPQEELY